MRRATLLVAVMFTAALVASATAYASHSWGNYHWARTSNPFTLQLGDNVSQAWDESLQTASTDWSTSSVLDTTVVAGTKDPTQCPPTSGRVEVCNAAYGNTGWLGVATIWVRGDHITQGTTKVNDTYFNTPTYDTPAWRRLVMCQEVGHTFGLDHQDENFDNPNLGTCMDYTRDPDGPPSNEHPNAHDYEQLEIIYKHTDKKTTVGANAARNQIPRAAKQMDTNNPQQWGKKIEESPDGRLEVYERDFGRGHKAFTFVVWESPQARSQAAPGGTDESTGQGTDRRPRSRGGDNRPS